MRSNAGMRGTFDVVDIFEYALRHFDHCSMSFSHIMTSSTCVDDLKYRIVVRQYASFRGLWKASQNFVLQVFRFPMHRRIHVWRGFPQYFLHP